MNHLPHPLRRESITVAKSPYLKTYKMSPSQPLQCPRAQGLEAQSVMKVSSRAFIHGIHSEMLPSTEVPAECQQGYAVTAASLQPQETHWGKTCIKQRNEVSGKASPWTSLPGRRRHELTPEEGEGEVGFIHKQGGCLPSQWKPYKKEVATSRSTWQTHRHVWETTAY